MRQQLPDFHFFPVCVSVTSFFECLERDLSIQLTFSRQQKWKSTKIHVSQTNRNSMMVELECEVVMGVFLWLVLSLDEK